MKWRVPKRHVAKDAPNVVIILLDVPAAMSLHFTSNATFDIGTDQDSPVSLDNYDQAPFTFNGTIGRTKIEDLKK